MAKESDIEKEILIHLNYRGVMCWKIKSVATFDPGRKIFRKPMPWYRLGVSDIGGIFQGKPLAIEVKRPKIKANKSMGIKGQSPGKLSDDQRSFLQDFQKHGGIAIVAYSLDDVLKILWPEKKP